MFYLFSPQTLALSALDSPWKQLANWDSRDKISLDWPFNLFVTLVLCSLYLSLHRTNVRENKCFITFATSKISFPPTFPTLSLHEAGWVFIRFYRTSASFFSSCLGTVWEFKGCTTVSGGCRPVQVGRSPHLSGGMLWRGYLLVSLPSVVPFRNACKVPCLVCASWQGANAAPLQSALKTQYFYLFILEVP